MGIGLGIDGNMKHRVFKVAVLWGSWDFEIQSRGMGIGMLWCIADANCRKYKGCDVE